MSKHFIIVNITYKELTSPWYRSRSRLRFEVFMYPDRYETLEQAEEALSKLRDGSSYTILTIYV